ncbi:MAG: hypothetical protein SFT81_07885 [Candidatus Caenarcaniphilales bacterium]|nr:hypothetical protein [Candidatus Caenarcaniphilales bacterium]
MPLSRIEPKSPHSFSNIRTTYTKKNNNDVRTSFRSQKQVIGYAEFQATAQRLINARLSNDPNIVSLEKTYTDTLSELIRAKNDFLFPSVAIEDLVKGPPRQEIPANLFDPEDPEQAQLITDLISNNPELHPISFRLENQTASIQQLIDLAYSVKPYLFTWDKLYRSIESFVTGEGTDYFAKYGDTIQRSLRANNLNISILTVFKNQSDMAHSLFRLVPDEMIDKITPWTVADPGMLKLFIAPRLNNGSWSKGLKFLKSYIQGLDSLLKVYLSKTSKLI